MKRIILFALFLAFSGFTEPKLVKTKIAEGMTVSLPKSFRPMDELDLTQRYPSVRQPIAAFTNEEREVDFSVNLSATQWPDTNLELARKFFKAGIYNLFDNVEMIDEGIHQIHGRDFIFFEFESRVKGDRRDASLVEPVLKYTYIQYLVEPGRTLVFSFHCPRRLQSDWQPTAHAIMKSIKLK
ncbi:MAG: hypothetical protein N2044_06870 [Cyclobacteriaceae bacterium]|nr:hypothetical protein [Cyclobacteriaceae bacterium]